MTSSGVEGHVPWLPRWVRAGLHGWLMLAVGAGAVVRAQAGSEAGPGRPAQRPNVVVIMTDDQGYGDFGVTGNELIHTPHLDTLARASAAMTHFYVSPVCSPTRASLMTGRYNYRTRCIDTYIGRSMMDPEEVTVAELLQEAGYATGIFGKWHLGDNYPMRPMEQGFDEALVHRGGGLAQPSEPPANEGRYTDPILIHNGREVQTTGYCTDVYFEAAMRFIEGAASEGRNFFVYIPTNAPHDPFHDVPEDWLERYRDVDFRPIMVNPPTDPERLAAQQDRLARIFAMISNVDENVGRLSDRLDALGLADDTIVIFLNDNGPNTARYAGPFRGMKTGVHEGGIRSPFWMRWSAALRAGTTSDVPSAHIDVMPTLLEACGVDLPAGLRIDGRSLLPLLRGESVDWPERHLVIQAHRGDVPVPYHHFMIRGPRYKLLNASGFGRETLPGEPAFELYDVIDDPGETTNLIDDRPEVAAALKAAYEAWFEDVSGTRPDNYAPPRIHIGTPHENPTVLTRQDWRRVSEDSGWAPQSLGYWELHVASPGPYDVRVRFVAPRAEAGTAELNVAGLTRTVDLPAGADGCTFDDLTLPTGPARLQVTLTHEGARHGPHQLKVVRR